MSKNDSTPKLGQRLNLWVAAGIVVLVGVTGAVIATELHGLNGITGKIVQDKSTDWTSTGPNAPFAAVTYYRDDQLRQIAQLEINRGSNQRTITIARDLLKQVNSFDLKLNAALAKVGLSRSQMVLPEPNLYAPYGQLNNELQAVPASNIDGAFKARLLKVETDLTRQVQVDAGQVASPELRQLAAEISAEHIDLVTKLNRP